MRPLDLEQLDYVTHIYSKTLLFSRLKVLFRATYELHSFFKLSIYIQ